MRTTLILLFFCALIYFVAHVLGNAYGTMIYIAILIGIYFVADGLSDIFTIYKISKSPILTLSDIKFQIIENYRFSRIGKIPDYSIKANGIYDREEVAISFKFACDNSFDKRKELNEFIKSRRYDSYVTSYKGNYYFKYFPISKQHALIKVIASTLSIAFIFIAYRIKAY